MAAAPVPVQLAAVPWEFPLVGRTRMLAEAWSADGVPHRFVEFPSLRSRARALAARVRHPLRAPRPAPPPFVLRPALPASVPWWMLPESTLAARTRRGARELRRALEREVRLEDAVALVVTPFWAPWLAELPFRHVVYDCIDELSVHVARPRLAPRFARWEEALLARCSGAVVTAEVLGAGLRARRPGLPLATIRNGVDDAWFQRRAREDPRPAELEGGTRPIVGFVGALYHWIDWALIDAASAALPELEFVFVGPHDSSGAHARLAGRANVRFLGPREYARVPAFMAAFDVCWVPFLADAVGRAANPVKLYEYLALGKPVVSTEVADLERFEGLVTRADGAAETVAALRAALDEGGARAEARRAFAARNSWRARARELARFLASLDGVPEAPEVAAAPGAR